MSRSFSQRLQIIEDYLDSSATAFTSDKLKEDNLPQEEGVSSTLIDSAVSGATKIYQVPVNKKFIPTRIIARCMSATGVTAIAQYSFGTNSPTYDNLRASAFLEITDAGDTMAFIADKIIQGTLVSGTDVFFNIPVPITGTSQIVILYLFGILV